MIVEAFQTLEDRDNIDQIETEGPFDCRRANAWLGFGYYFWDSNIKWAISWGENSYNKFGKEFVIAKCRIDLSKDCFDLVGNIQHQLTLEEIIDVMVKSGKIKNEIDKIVPNLILFMNQQKIFNFKSIRANDMQQNVMKIYFSKGQKEYLIINQRVQICVIEKKDVVLRPFSVIYPEKYLI